LAEKKIDAVFGLEKGGFRVRVSPAWLGNMITRPRPRSQANVSSVFYFSVPKHLCASKALAWGEDQIRQQEKATKISGH
jgi:hypothetical protein